MIERQSDKDSEIEVDDIKKIVARTDLLSITLENFDSQHKFKEHAMSI